MYITITQYYIGHYYILLQIHYYVLLHHYDIIIKSLLYHYCIIIASLLGIITSSITTL